MKHLRYLLLPLFLVTTSYELVTDYSFVEKKHPIHIDAEGRYIGRAKFYTHPVRGSHANYADAHTFAYYSHFLTPENTLSWKLGYSFLQFNWPKNPRFRDDDYHFVNASVGWVSTSVKDWRWVLSAGASIDAQTWNLGQSGVYYGLMWGRYQFSPAIGMHIGWAGYAGVKNGYVLPIVGIDLKMTERWILYGIFPINLSIKHLFNTHWSTTLAIASFGRPYRFPMRIHGGVDRFKNGIFEVYSKGLELDFNYAQGNLCTVSIGGGWNFGGWILIKDHANHHGKYYKYEGAPYLQGKLTLTF